MRLPRFAAALVAALCAKPAQAQLRPLEPISWSAFHARHGAEVSGTAGLFLAQRVSLAGVRGDLLELGELRLTLRTGRVVIEVAGTPQRFLWSEEFVEGPAGGARDMSAARSRRDAGDYRVGTAIRLHGTANAFEVLRFGTRLPTTDNRIGLDRDQTDFFALLGVHRSGSRFSLGAEAGVSINGTRRVEYEQSDVLAYDVSLAYRAAPLRPLLVLVGQNDLRAERTRGVENLSEARLLLEVGSTRWIRFGAVFGMTEFSPRIGWVVSAGARWGG